MGKCDCRHSCRNCIWNDQCEDDHPCGFYDDGRDSIDLTDKELLLHADAEKMKFQKEYEKYVSEDYDERKYELFKRSKRNLS